MQKLIFIAVLFSFSASLAGDNAIVVKREKSCNILEILFTNCMKTQPELKVSVPSNPAPSVIVSENSAGMFIATGKAAENIIAANAEKSAPKAPKMQAVYKDRQLLGGITEIEPGSDIYIASRHLFQGHDRIEHAMLGTDLSIGNYRPYTFKDAEGLPLDIVMLASYRYSDREEELFARIDRLARPPKLEDHYASYQFGALPGGVLQLSRGKISQVSVNHFYLPLDAGQLATARSSGSLVYTRSTRSQWGVSGLVDCYIPTKRSAEGLEIKGAIRVIDLSQFSSWDVSDAQWSDLENEPYPQNKSCIPIDSRAAGGL